MVCNSSFTGVLGIDPRRPVVMVINQHPVGFDVVDRAVLAIGVRMKTVPRVRCDQLQRESYRELCVVEPFPAWDIAVNRRPFRVFAEVLETRGLEFKFSGLGLQTFSKIAAVFRGQRRRLGCVFLSALGIPVERYRRLEVLGFGGHHVIAFFQKLLPTDDVFEV